MTLKVNEIFYSMQGESLYAGCPCVFIRLTGCNLRCAYCDTAYAYAEGSDMEISEILAQVQAFTCPLVEVTGGEPLFQGDTPRLVKRLLEKGYRVLMETNGSMDISIVDQRCIKIVDIKCPSSGEHGKNDFENLNRLTSKDQVKFVIGTREDYEFAKETVSFRCGLIQLGHIFFSSVHGKMNTAELARWILEDNLNARLQVQLHKIIWPDKNRGV